MNPIDEFIRIITFLNYIFQSFSQPHHIGH